MATHAYRHPRKLRRPLALAIALACASCAATSWAQTAQGALPRVGNLASGQVGFSVNPGRGDIVTPTETMTLTQTSKGAVINWGSFDVGAQNTLNFVYQVAGGGSGVTLNRVVGFDGPGTITMSNIAGAINATGGTVFLINPAGALFGSGATINVGGLVASTTDISDANFNAGVSSGHYVFNGSLGSGNIENDGSITASANGLVALFGNQVSNYGNINTPQGTTGLAAGGTFTLDVGGDGLTQLTINTGATNANGVSVTNEPAGRLVADGGQVTLQAASVQPVNTVSFAAVVNDGLVQAHSLQSRNGRIYLSSSSDNGSDSVTVSGGTLDASGTAAGTSGGSITIDGNTANVQIRPIECARLPCIFPVSRLDVSGTTGGGTINLDARNTATIDGTSSLDADATGNGNGGSILVNGATTLYGYGSYSARGGANGGNGGLIETSGDNVVLNGIVVDASAPLGTSGRWLIDPENVEIVSGSATNPAPPAHTSQIQDSDIGNALNTGTSVAIHATFVPDVAAGDITIDNGVSIARTANTAVLNLELDADGGISGSGFGITSSAGPLNMLFDSDAAGLAGGGIAFSTMNLLSNGGSISMYGQNDPVNGYANGISLAGINSVIDTRTGSSDTAAAGNLVLRGEGGAFGVQLNAGYTQPSGTAQKGLTLDTGTGNITIIGQGGDGGDGIDLAAPTIVPLQLISSSGNITMTGFAGAADVDADQGGTGISMTLAPQAAGSPSLLALQSASGMIDLRGCGAADFTDPATGLVLTSNGIFMQSGVDLLDSSGNIFLTGSSLGSGFGIVMQPARSASYVASSINAGSGNIVLRAHNAPATPNNVLQLAGNISTTGLAAIRGGSVDANGNIVENPADPIAINPSTPVAGISLYSGDLASIAAGTLVLGSDIQTGNVYVDAASGNIGYGGNLTLDAAGGGSVGLNGGAVNVGTYTLALLADGNITQAGAITAGSLLATSTRGSVLLTNPANQVSASTVAGSAGGDFDFVNAGDVGIGTVAATSIAAASNAPTTLTASGIAAAGNVLAQSVGGNLLLNGNVSGNDVNLVADAGLLLNNGNAAITAAGYWRVWTSSWVDENRGGLAGSGPLPNLYGCAYGASCSVTPAANANQFIYVAQPTATIDIANQSREYGLPNGPLSYVINGLILGDNAANAITGSTNTSATQASNVGNYAIGGSFASPAGYLIELAPGTLAVTPATLTYIANPYSRIYGDPNGALTGSVTGFRNSDTLTSATTGTLAFTTPATPASNVGSYSIDGGGLTATNYVFAQAAGNATALSITPATLFYAADPYSRIYGDPNGTLSGGVTGFRNGDTLASVTTGTLAFATPATQASNVGSYAIDGSGLTATNYVFAQAAGNATAFSITPATLTYVANPLQRLVGTPNGPLGGSVTGFRNGDTQASATSGTLAFQSPAGTDSPVGTYGILGSGLAATNYVFVQADGNATALTIDPPLATYSLDVMRDTPETYVYDRNFGIVGLCPATDLAADSREQEGDVLAREWSRVRSRPNLANCISTKQKNSCGDF